MHAAIFGPVDTIRLDALARCVAGALLLYIADRSRTPYEWLSAVGYHVPPALEFSDVPSGLPLLPGFLVLPFVVVFLGAIAGVVLLRPRRALIGIVLTCLLYVSFADQDAAFSLNKFFIVTFAILLVRPRRQAVPGSSRFIESGWALRAIQASIVIHYFAAGVCKIIPGDWVVVGGMYQGGGWVPASQWFAGPEADVLRTQIVGIYRTTLAAWMVRTLPTWCWSAMQYSALIFELLAPLLFLVRRLRPLGIVWGTAFHLTIALTMYKVGLFNLQMITFFTVFVDAALLHRINDRLRWGRASSVG